jgi:uncharacterized protein (DUF1800 family)
MSRLNVDVDWAWSPFEPTDEASWDRQAVAHLYRRAGFGANWDAIEVAADRDPGDLVAELVSAEEPDSFRADMNALLRAALATGNVKQLSAQWVYRMLNTPAPLLEKLTLFWHGHFATSAAKVNDAELMQVQNDLLRTHALGDFSQLLLEISRDPAMLLYLDSATNRKSHPNENYAREIMELFSLGEGNYGEHDIRELARCFTGWEVKRKEFRFNRYQHDSGTKSVLGTTGQLAGEDGVNVVASHEATPRFLTRKLLRFFLMDDFEIPNNLVEPLANQLREDDLQIGPTVQRILGSNLFFSPLVRGRKIRSPVELGVGFLVALDGTTDSFQLADAFEQLGQGLYLPPSVKGWDGGRSWINSSTLLGRANLIHDLLDGGKTRFAGQTISQWVQAHGLTTPAELMDRLEALLFAVSIPESSRQRINELVGQQGREPNWAQETIYAVCTLPEFQLA